MKLRINNFSYFVGKKQGEDWYEWCVFIDSEENIIKEIKYVEYILHSTFPNPLRKIEDRFHRFALYSSGWGEFSVKIRAVLYNGSETIVRYWLQLDKDNWPKKERPQQFMNHNAEIVYDALLHDEYRWRKISTLERLTKLSENEILNTLKSLVEEELVRKSPIKSIDNLDMWGATSIVGCAPKI